MWASFSSLEAPDPMSTSRSLNLPLENHVYSKAPEALNALSKPWKALKSPESPKARAKPGA